MTPSLRGTSTVEVMLVLLATAVVLAVSYSAQSSLLKAYQDQVHKERAELFALETFEQIEALRLSRRWQQFQERWDGFLGSFGDGELQLVQGSDVHDLGFVPVGASDELSVLEYFSDSPGVRSQDGLYTRLERRIFLETAVDAKTLTVSVYWGIPGRYRSDDLQQVRLQAQYGADDAPAFIL